MYFVNIGHQRNFILLQKKFTKIETNKEYRSCCYIAALPDIFTCFVLDKQVNGPFDWYFECLAHGESKSGSVAPLTGQTIRLVELALNLWNGHWSVDLSDGLDTWDHDVYQVALQAIDLRRFKPSFEFCETKIQNHHVSCM